MIFCQVGLGVLFTGLGSNPFQGMSWRHSNCGMVKGTVRPCTLSVKSTMFWMIEGTFHFLTSREVAAELTVRRWCWCCNWFWRQDWKPSTQMRKGTIWFRTLCIVFTIWMNKQTFFSKLTVGKSLAR